MTRVAVLCWEESRPWVSALRQKGFSVPWVEEPKGDVYKQIPGIEPDVLLVDMTRMPERGKGMIVHLAKGGHLKSVPVILVSDSDSASRGLKGKFETVIVTTPKKIISAVKSAVGPAK
jgi:DNA-binding response OmpR family regulator